MFGQPSIPTQIAVQLAVALLYVGTFRLQLLIPAVPGTDFASLIFLPSIIRAGATLITGNRAIIGLFTGSVIIGRQMFPDESMLLWPAFASAISAPLTYALFVGIGLLRPVPLCLRYGDPIMLYLFAASYAVINAGLHLIGFAVLVGRPGTHVPYFPIMVLGDFVPVALGITVWIAVRRAFWGGRRPQD